MTLDDAIKHARYVAEADCVGCAEDHLQLAEWLEDYKRLKKLEKEKVDSLIEKLENLSKDYCEEYNLYAGALYLDDVIDLVKEVMQNERS